MSTEPVPWPITFFVGMACGALICYLVTISGGLDASLDVPSKRVERTEYDLAYKRPPVDTVASD